MGQRVFVCAASALAFVLAAAGARGEAGVPSRITSWNAYSKQFIDAPEFRLLTIPATVEYRAVVAQGSRSWTVRSQRPEVSLEALWRRVAAKKFSLTLELWPRHSLTEGDKENEGSCFIAFVAFCDVQLARRLNKTTR